MDAAHQLYSLKRREKDFLKKAEAFKNAAVELTEAWGHLGPSSGPGDWEELESDLVNHSANENYPFKESFDEVAAKIAAWYFETERLHKG